MVSPLIISLPGLPQGVPLVYDAILSRETLRAGYNCLNDGHIISVNPGVDITQTPGSRKTVIQAYTDDVPPVHLIEWVYKKLVLRFFNSKETIVPGDAEVLPSGLRGISEGLKRLEHDPGSAVTHVLDPVDIV
ncbi:hypothetical protein BDQ17DRAFT_480517 [Cyathus striatus]|nr:hypothetical protein BDQ17DRAFT_480517 [Cyathus striatus]